MKTTSPLGVGFTWQPGLQAALGRGWELLDFVEISPDVLCRESMAGGGRRLEYREALLAEALRTAAERPVVIHGLGLSIGTAAGWDEEYLRILDLFHERQPFCWHSDHLACLTAAPQTHAGIPLPLPLTDEAIALVAPRARALGERYGVPFLLENITHYLPNLPTERGRDEIAFLNDLTEAADCGLLLDLYNFHCNAVNFGFDALEALSRLRLDRVIEIHLAGGAAHDGFLTDVHTREVPEPVWELLEWIAPRAPNLAGIVYEVMEQAVPRLGPARLTAQLERVRAVWDARAASKPERSAHAAR
ncbi:MAG: DUF692 family protein [Blastocatellia bacterium]|nr:DUF692 family protein [Blastocatellia bacterium]